MSPAKQYPDPPWRDFRALSISHADRNLRLELVVDTTSCSWDVFVWVCTRVGWGGGGRVQKWFSYPRNLFLGVMLWSNSRLSFDMFLFAHPRRPRSRSRDGRKSYGRNRNWRSKLPISSVKSSVSDYLLLGLRGSLRTAFPRGLQKAAKNWGKVKLFKIWRRNNQESERNNDLYRRCGKKRRTTTELTTRWYISAVRDLVMMLSIAHGL